VFSCEHGRAHIAGRARRTLKLGNAPVSWGVSEATGGRQPAPEAFLREVAACGYRGIELGPLGYLPAGPDGLRASLDRHGLQLVGAFCPVTLHDRARRGAALADADRLIELLAACGAPMLVLADASDDRRRSAAGRVPADGSAGLTDAEWSVFAEGANEVARRAAARGLATSFHPHAATYVETPEEIEALLGRTDPSLVGLCLDTGHVTYGGGDPVAVARRYAARISHVHLKDVRRAILERTRDAGGLFATAVAAGVFAPLGAGDVDFGGVFGALGPGYDGWLVVEQDRVVAETDAPTAAKDDALRSLRYLEGRTDRA
jgi:inosose dehydratase